MLYCLTEHFGSVQPPKCIFGSMTKCCCQHIENKADDTSPSVSLLPAPCCIPLHFQPRMDSVILCFIVLYFKAEFLAFSCHPCSFQNNLVAVDQLQTHTHKTLFRSGPLAGYPKKSAESNFAHSTFTLKILIKIILDWLLFT